MKPVYNGYEEHLVTCSELKEMFPDEYISNGRHHSTVLGITVKEFLSVRRSIVDDKKYRIFMNDNFCKVMPENGDKQLAFFSHVRLDNARLSHSPEEARINTVCPECGSKMEYKEGKYGAFLGCTGYPECKHTEKILILGNL